MHANERALFGILSFAILRGVLLFSVSICMHTGISLHVCECACTHTCMHYGFMCVRERERERECVKTPAYIDVHTRIIVIAIPRYFECL